MCTGSGAGLLNSFFGSDAQVYITGDLKYHEARSVESQGRGAIDIGHFSSEHLVVEHLTGQLKSRLRDLRITVDVSGYKLERDPFILY